MRAEFNKPHLMGNCKDCYYFAPSWREDSDEGVCHRYPQPFDKWDMAYCGEFAWRKDAERREQ